jgi:UDP-N-acetylmuramoylalanine-D-glutamate ligase
LNAPFAGQSIAVLGLGASGEAAAVLLREEGAVVTVLDTADRDALRHRADRLERLGIRVVAGAGAPRPTGRNSTARCSVPASIPRCRWCAGSWSAA